MDEWAGGLCRRNGQGGMEGGIGSGKRGWGGRERESERETMEYVRARVNRLQ